ncbi:MAG: hypothetical protein ACI4HO_08885 [Ruminococcus sp.]
MAKKRNCRMTPEEKIAHAKATKLRKMTDSQLCEFVTEQYNLGMNEGAQIAEKQTQQTTGEKQAIEKFINYLETRKGSGNGIGGGSIYRLRKELALAITAGAIGEAV